MASAKELELWVLYAEEDLGSAKTLISAKKPYLSAACFHAQQCAEKYLKALLLLKDVDFPKTHDLLTLDFLCSQNGIFTGFEKEKLILLSKHAVQTRYPGGQPTREEAKEMIEIALMVRKFSRTFMGLKK